MSEPLYTREILRLAAATPHVGLLSDADGTGDLRSPTCGSRMRVAVRVDRDGRIAALGQAVEACAFGQASASLMGAHAVGRSRANVSEALSQLTSWLNGTRDDPGDWPGLENLAPARPKAGRHGAILLPFRTLLAALDAVP